MHGRMWLAGSASLLLVATGTLTSFGQSWCNPEPCRYNCEPRIKFLDDLVSLGHAESTRDPWEERIETDRHDFTQSATTVGRGVSQIEMGYSYFYRDNADEIEQTHTTPEMMLRVGLTDDVEFRVRWDYTWQFVDEGESIDGAEDLRWSFKLATTEQDCWIPESALEIRFTVPTGGSALTTKRVEFGLDYIYDWKLSDVCRVYGSSGLATNALDDVGLVPDEPAAERFVVWSQSAAVGLELNEKMTMYNEVYGLFSHALVDEYRIVVYNIGVDYYVTDDLVLDLRVGMGLTPDSDDFFTGVGGGYRF